VGQYRQAGDVPRTGPRSVITYGIEVPQNCI